MNESSDPSWVRSRPESGKPEVVASLSVSEPAIYIHSTYIYIYITHI